MSCYNDCVEDIELLVKAAQKALGAHGDGKNHTVAAAIKTGDGTIVTGLNVYHFTGGPCAELSVLANALSSGKTDLKTIVAVGDRDRGILAPCGRCRQVLFDYSPDTAVIVMEEGKLAAKTIRELLPHAYDWNAEQSDA